MISAGDQCVRCELGTYREGVIPQSSLPENSTVRYLICDNCGYKRRC